MSTIVRAVCFAVLALLSAALETNTAVAAEHSNRIEFRLVRAGFIVGIGSGSGSVFYRGKRYPIDVSGVSMGATIGLASVDLVGRAYNVKRLRDIAGTYTAVGTGLAVAGGTKTARLRNSRGVELQLRGRQIGFMASIDLSGLRVALSR